MDRQKMKVREPAVAGQFYPGSKADLEEAVRRMTGKGPARRAIGAMVPHAGYIYSGAVAGEVFGGIEPSDSYVILGPNHTGIGPAASIMSSGIWKTPCGNARIDEALAGAIAANSDVLEEDDTAHAYEHSIEVQIPFLQCARDDFQFVPIDLMTSDKGTCSDVGHAIATAIRFSANPVTILASSDMTHYESQARTVAQDHAALERILDLDAGGLLEVVHERNITMCGVAPVAAMIYASHELGATEAELVRYQTSGDVTGDFGQVVGYAGVIIR